MPCCSCKANTSCCWSSKWDDCEDWLALLVSKRKAFISELLMAFSLVMDDEDRVVMAELVAFDDGLAFLPLA